MQKWKNTDVHGLKSIIGEELTKTVLPEISDMAAAIAAQHGSSRAVLFYGSALRATDLDGLMLDFYLIVDDYHQAYSHRWLAWANKALPPNVFLFRYKDFVAKYAVLTLSDFRRLASLETLSVSVWARFAQPSRWSGQKTKILSLQQSLLWLVRHPLFWKRRLRSSRDQKIPLTAGAKPSA